MRWNDRFAPIASWPGRGLANLPILRPCQFCVAGKLCNLVAPQNCGSNAVATHLQIGISLALAGKTVPTPKTLRKRTYAEHMAFGCKGGSCIWGQFHRPCIGNASGRIKTKLRGSIRHNGWHTEKSASGLKLTRSLGANSGRPAMSRLEPNSLLQ